VPRTSTFGPRLFAHAVAGFFLGLTSGSRSIDYVLLTTFAAYRCARTLDLLRPSVELWAVSLEARTHNPVSRASTGDSLQLAITNHLIAGARSPLGPASEKSPAKLSPEELRIMREQLVNE